MAKLGCAIPKTVLLPQKGYPPDVDLTSESLRNLEYPIDWDALLDYVGRPAILKPYSGGGWKHVYKVNDKARAARGLRPDVAVLHDAAGVHQLRSLRALLHVRQDRHHAGRLRPARAPLPRRSHLPVGRARRARGARRADDQPGARLRDEHDRVRHHGRRALRDRLPQPGAGLRTRPHHRVLLQPRRREDVGAGDRPRAQRDAVAVVAALGADAGDRARRAASPGAPESAARWTRSTPGMRCLRRERRSSRRSSAPTSPPRCDAQAHVRRPRALPVPAPVLPDRGGRGADPGCGRDDRGASASASWPPRSSPGICSTSSA